jgi:nucleoside-diphosphate-sugar epimerase
MPLQVNGDGLQERSFCYIDDFIDCMMKLLNTEFIVDSVFNIGNPEPVRIIELAELVNSITGNPSFVTFSERYPYEPRYRTPNIDKIRGWIGWEPVTSIKEGLTKMLESFRIEEIGGEVRCRTQA